MKFGIELPENLRKALRVAVASQSIKLKDAAEQAFAMWLASKDELPIESLHLRHKSEIALLEFILDHGTPEDIALMRGNLRTLAELVKLHQDVRKRKAAG